MRRDREVRRKLVRLAGCVYEAKGIACTWIYIVETMAVDTTKAMQRMGVQLDARVRPVRVPRSLRKYFPRGLRVVTR